MAGIIYRKLNPAEAADFRRVRLECLRRFPDQFGSLYADEAARPKLYFEELIERNAPDAFFFGAFADDDLIGIAGFVRGDRTKTRHRGELVAMYVDPGFRGQKVGENLVREVVRAAFETAAVEQIHLTVVADNLPAVRLYERIGFETFGVQKEYFKLHGKSWDQRFMQLMKDRFDERNPS